MAKQTIQNKYSRIFQAQILIVHELFESAQKKKLIGSASMALRSGSIDQIENVNETTG